MNSLISDLEEILSTRITDEEADSGSKVFTDVFSTGLYAYTTYESGNLPKIALPLANIINQEALDDLVERKNLSSAWAPLVLDATLQLPSQVSAIYSPRVEYRLKQLLARRRIT